MKIDLKNITKMVIALIVTCYIGYVAKSILLLFGISINPDNKVVVAAADFILTLILLVAFTILLFDDIKGDIKKIPSKYGSIPKLIETGFIAFLILFGAKIGVSLACSFIYELCGLSTDTTINNQKLIEELLVGAPAMMIISVVLLAPMEEEILFRGLFGKAIKNKRVFISVSGLIFGLMHVTDSFTLLMEIILLGLVIDYIISLNLSKDMKVKLSVMSLVIIGLIFMGIYYFEYGNLIAHISKIDLYEAIGSIVYISMGCMLAYIYKKEDNICVPILVHMFNNLFGVLVMLLTMKF